MKILVAEDNPVNQALLKTMLEKLGHEVSFADTGDGACQLALAEKFDLIFMDIEMPGANGVETTLRLRQKGIDTPIIAISAHVDGAINEEYSSAGINDAIGKPFTQKLLSEKIVLWTNLGTNLGTNSEPPPG